MENANTKNLRHIYDLPHSVPTIPELSSIYTSKLYKTFHRKNLTLPNQISNGLKFCSNCETILIPGINMTMRIIYSKSKKSKKHKKGSGVGVWKPRDRKLRYTCTSCNHHTFFELLKPETKPIMNEDTGKLEAVMPVKEQEKPAFVATWEPGKNKKKNTAKERAKKRKKNNLSNLLTNKKERDEQEKKKSSLLSLDEFMKG